MLCPTEIFSDILIVMYCACNVADLLYKMPAISLLHDVRSFSILAIE